MTRRNRRPRFNGSADDHAATELLASLTTDPEDGATYQWGGGSDIGLMPGGVMVIEVSGPAPLAGARPYAPYPDAFPVLPPAPEAVAAPPPASAEITEPAVIGDALRLPVIWCEMPGCISWFRDPAAAGFADARDRAHAAGWRTDALGRFACPPCQQGRADYRTPQQLAWHHPEVARRWHEDGTLPGEKAQARLEAEAECFWLLFRKDPALARAIAGATHRTASAS